MHTPKAYSDGYVSAVFSYEFVDDDVIERIHRGEVDDWIVDVAGSGCSRKQRCAQSPKVGAVTPNRCSTRYW